MEWAHVTGCSTGLMAWQALIMHWTAIFTIAAVSIRVEVMTQADYVAISILGQVELSVKTKLRKWCVMLFYNLPLEHTTTEKMAPGSGPFIKWNLRKTVKRETHLPESCLNQRAYSLHHKVNLAQHVNFDICYSQWELKLVWINSRCCIKPLKLWKRFT